MLTDPLIQDTASKGPGDVDVVLAGGAGGCDLPAEERFAGQAHDVLLDSVASGAVGGHEVVGNGGESGAFLPV